MHGSKHTVLKLTNKGNQHMYEIISYAIVEYFPIIVILIFAICVVCCVEVIVTTYREDLDAMSDEQLKKYLKRKYKK